MAFYNIFYQKLCSIESCKMQNRDAFLVPKYLTTFYVTLTIKSNRTAVILQRVVHNRVRKSEDDRSIGSRSSTSMDL